MENSYISLTYEINPLHRETRFLYTHSLRRGSWGAGYLGGTPEEAVQTILRKLKECKIEQPIKLINGTVDSLDSQLAEEDFQTIKEELEKERLDLTFIE